MQDVILSCIRINEFNTLIKKAVKEAIQDETSQNPDSSENKFKYVPIKEIFDRKICSKPTFYLHLKKGTFTLYKLGNKSYVDLNEFENAFKSIRKPFSHFSTVKPMSNQDDILKF